jgi:hypothetical protein
MRNIPPDACRKQHRLLRDQPDLPAEPADVQRLEVMAVQQHRPREGVVEPLYEADDGGFARSGRADEGAGFAGFEFERQAYVR